ARSVEVLMTTDTFAEDGVFTSESLDAAARARSSFTVAVRATSTHGTHRGHLWGHDIYRVGAIASVEAAARLAADPTPPCVGVLSAAEPFAPDDFPAPLQQRGLLPIDYPPSTLARCASSSPAPPTPRCRRCGG